MYYEVNEQDWKLFREKLVNWQENYIAKLNQEYIQILSRDGNAVDNFWKLGKRMKRDKRRIGVIADMRRSMMLSNLIDLLREEVISLNDLDGFSEDLVWCPSLFLVETQNKVPGGYLKQFNSCSG